MVGEWVVVVVVVVEEVVVVVGGWGGGDKWRGLLGNSCLGVGFHLT